MSQQVDENKEYHQIICHHLGCGPQWIANTPRNPRESVHVCAALLSLYPPPKYGIAARRLTRMISNFKDNDYNYANGTCKFKSVHTNGWNGPCVSWSCSMYLSEYEKKVLFNKHHKNMYCKSDWKDEDELKKAIKNLQPNTNEFFEINNNTSSSSTSKSTSKSSSKSSSNSTSKSTSISTSKSSSNSSSNSTSISTSKSSSNSSSKSTSISTSKSSSKSSSNSTSISTSKSTSKSQIKNDDSQLLYPLPPSSIGPPNCNKIEIKEEKIDFIHNQNVRIQIQTDNYDYDDEYNQHNLNDDELTEYSTEDYERELQKSNNNYNNKEDKEDRERKKKKCNNNNNHVEQERETGKKEKKNYHNNNNNNDHVEQERETGKKEKKNYDYNNNNNNHVEQATEINKYNNMDEKFLSLEMLIKQTNKDDSMLNLLADTYITRIYHNHEELRQSMSDNALKGFDEAVLQILKQCLNGKVKSTNGTIWLLCFYFIRTVVMGLSDCFGNDIEKMKKAIINSFVINLKYYNK